MVEKNTLEYQKELQQVLLVWTFSFDCSNCMRKEIKSDYTYISETVKGSKSSGTYPIAPVLWCGCDELLYIFRSHGFYELFEALFDKDNKNMIIIYLKDYNKNITETDE